MRSHKMNYYDSSKNHKEQEETESIDRSCSSPSSCSSHPSSDDNDAKEDPMKSSIFADQELSSDLVQEYPESEEAESSKGNRVSQRSKRKFISPNDDEYSSSISDTTTEEHLAHCLIMLSRDKWDREDILEYNSSNGFLEEDRRTEDSGFAKKSMLKRSNGNKVRGRYRCETCNKLFKSYQALGGHRASHKKIKPEKPVGERIRPEEPCEKLHKCPFCERVFTSGQALGGHKRTHTLNGGGGGNFVNSPNVGSSSSNKIIGGESLMIDIDLNLPASVDRDDEINSLF